MDEQQLIPESAPTGRLSSNRWLGILAIVAFLLLLGAGYVWWRSRQPKTPVINQPTVQTNTVVNTAAVAPVETAPSKIPVIVKPDTDNDGLSDEEEKTAGTRADLADTDADKLTDYEEVKIYRTNPLVPDTDKDGYIDGLEVQNMMNPNGPGKLRDLKQAIELIKKN